MNWGIASVRARVATWFLLGVFSMFVARSARAITLSGGTDGFDSTCNLRRAVRAINNGANDGACTGVAPNWSSNVIDFSNVPLTRIDPALGAITLNEPTSVTFQGAGYGQTVVEREPTSLSSGQAIVLNGWAEFDGITFRNFKGRVISSINNAQVTLNYIKFVDNGNFTSSGGCVYNEINLSVNHSEFDNCIATTGAAIENFGSAVISNSTFLRNQGERGAALYNAPGASADVFASTFGSNHTTVYGSAVQNGGYATITRSTVAYNSCSGTSYPTLCTALSTSSPGTLQLTGTVVANNTGANTPNCIGPITSGGYNLIGESSATSCSYTPATGDLTPQNPQLLGASGNLPDYWGGVGRVYLPDTTSPLLGRIPIPTSFLTYDQRGMYDVSTADIGAVERANALLVVNNSGALTTGDNKLKSTLTRLGFSVTVVSGAASSAALANGKALVAIAESVTSTDVNTKFRSVSAGVLVAEPSLFDDMRMTGTAATDFGSTAGITGVTLSSANGCPIASKIGLSGFQTASSSSSYGWGRVDPAYACAAVSATHAGIFWFAQGWTLPGGGTAAGARVGFFGTEASMSVLNSNGTRMLEEAILLASSGAGT